MCLLVMALAACGKADDTESKPDRITESEGAVKIAQEAADTSKEADAQDSMQKTDGQENLSVEEEKPDENAEPTDKAAEPSKENVKPENKDAESADGESISSVWAGKKVTICGDSISTFTGYIPDYYSKFYPENGDIREVGDTWWMQVVRRTGMELLRNASYSGSTVSGQSQDNHDGKFGCGNQRIADLAGTDGAAPDVIIILMGANDLLNDIPLGAYDGSSEVPEGNIETFSEAYALMLDKMKLWYPEADIYCCTIAEVSRWNDETGEKFPYMNAHSLTAKDYNAWITAIAQTKGVKLIDVYNCGLTYENAKENTSDGTHPNAAGAKLIANKVCETFQ